MHIRSASNSAVHYAMNFEEKSLQCQLSKFAINVNSRVNNSEASRGINVPTFYLSSSQSITPMHIEDHCLDAINLIIHSEDDAMKLWLIVHPAFYAYINRMLVEKIHKIRNEDKSQDVNSLLSKWDDNCSHPLHHKSLVITTAFLRKHKIRYEIVVQKPGDIIYVRPGLYHQVVNTGITFAEAVNVGSALWHLNYYLFDTCVCLDRCIDYVEPNFTAQHNQVTVKQSALDFKCNICPAYFHVDADLQEHKELHSGFICELCEETFASKFSLERHIKSFHDKLPKKARRGYVTCSVCNNGVKKEELRDDMRCSEYRFHVHILSFHDAKEIQS